MATFQCTVCKKTIETQIEKCCAPDVLCKDKEIYHCGKPMMEIID